MKNQDTRRYRRRKDGVVFRIILQARSHYGPCDLQSDPINGVVQLVATTNDKLQVDFEFFEVAEPDFQI